MGFKLVHTNLNVHDLDKSVAFYQSALGLQVVRRIQPPGGLAEMAFLSDESGSHQIELTWVRDHAPYDLGDNKVHICLGADDLDAAYASHLAMGYVQGERSHGGRYMIQDPDGYWLEITRLP